MADAARDTGDDQQPITLEDRIKSLLKIKLHQSMNKTERSGPLTILRMPLERVKDQKIWEYGTLKADKQNKVIMMVGETGSGKTSLINTMINYICNVQWGDDRRFQLISDSARKSQAHSQTSRLTTYRINHEEAFLIPYSITIIDTPGFGDTRGIKYDRKIMQQVRDFFCYCGFSEIDAICFVVQSSLARLTTTQRYIYDNVLSIFGKDIKDNIVFFTTFADRKNPVVLSAITEAKIPCARSQDGLPMYFMVNNGMLYSSNCPDEEDELDDYKVNEGQWKFTMRSLNDFLNHFLPKLTSRSLCLTKDVLRKTNALEIILEGLMEKLDEMMVKQHELEETERVLKEHRADIEKNVNFDFQVKFIVKKKKYTDENSINCSICNSTCHQDCLVSTSVMAYFCEVFKFGGTCKVCKHGQRDHTSDKFFWENVIKIKRTSYLEIKEDYKKLDHTVMTCENVLSRLKTDIENSNKEVERLIEKTIKKFRALQEIALKPITGSAVDYIDLLIETERREAKNGSEERIKMLEKYKTKFDVLNEIGSQKTGGEGAESINRENDLAYR